MAARRTGASHGLARAYVAGDLDIEGDLYAALDSAELIEQLAGNDGLGMTGRQKVQALGTLVHLGAFGRRPALPVEELVRGRRTPRLRHNQESDAAAVSHHYDVGNDFYALVLGPSMVLLLCILGAAAFPFPRSG